MLCKICNSESTIIFSKTVLSKHKVNYHSCKNCGFIQPDEPFWLQEAYESAISDMDTGIFVRNYKNKKLVSFLLKFYFNKKAKFLDYGAGYGIFVRMMRDNGFDFWGIDEYATPLFSKKFDIKNHKIENLKFEAITCFEVFEHLENPKVEIEKMLTFSDTIIFSTSLSDPIYEKNGIESIKNWWYISEETGQHISIYSYKSLEILAQNFQLKLYSNRYNFHILSKKRINPIIFTLLFYAKKLKDIFSKNHVNHSAVDREKLK